jgi:signal transduction histidine kinase
MLNKLTILKSVLLSALIFVFSANITFSQIFSQVVKEQSDFDYKIPFIVLTILSLTIIFYLYKSKNLASNNAINSEKQSKELVNAFAQLSSAIEKRDVKLRDDYKNIKIINESKTDFLLDVSHEIRTPMHAILNFAEIGQKKIDNCDTEKIKFYFSRIEESGLRLLNLINSILDLTVLESGKVFLKFENGCIIDCLENVIKDLNSLIEKKNLSIQINKSDDNIYCKIDKPHITRVILNILSNSIKFSPEGSNIYIDIKKVKDYKQIAGESVLLSISDEGVGVPEDELAIIFNKFVQSSNASTDNSGSGIGLAICKEIIGLHKGAIWVENNKDKGAKFSFVIPKEFAS